jgi:osmotically-inducible protein OsmY
LAGKYGEHSQLWVLFSPWGRSRGLVRRRLCEGGSATAEKAVKRVYGVRGVANDIEVKLASTRSDPEIARDAIHELESHIGIPSEKIKVTVKSGWVTLEGNVGLDWQYQKILAESAVKKLRGVIGITNNIEIEPKVSPKEAKGKIEEALRRSAELDARGIRVEVD